MAISSIGVGSNLPLAELLDNLRLSHQPKLTAIETRQKSVDARITAYGQLKSELTNLSNAAKALSGDAFKNMKSTVTGSDFKATSAITALPGNYNIKVTSLASAQSLAAAGQASRTADIGTGGGTIKFTVGGVEKTVELTEGSSLEDVVKAINGKSDLGVQATLLNNGSGTPHQLILTAKGTGTQAAVTKIEVEGNDDLQTVLGFGGAGSTVSETAAKNAELTVNGVAISSQTNTLNNVIDGVTLTLTGASGSDGKLEVDTDKDGIKKAITEFVDRYNDVLKKLKQVTSYDLEKQSGSALTGDSIARSIQTGLAGVLNSPVSGGAFSMLSEIGVRTNPQTGQLEINQTKLDKALTEKPDDVRNLFQGADGVGQKAMDMASGFTDARTGTLTTATEGANKLRKDLEKQFDTTEMRIEAQMEILRKQFTAMDKLVSQMNSTSSYLAQQLSQLGNNSK